VVTELASRGIRRLTVEGGQNTHTQFLAAGLADELQLVIAPFFVGDPDAPGFVGAATFPWNCGHRMTLAEARAIGDVVLLRYLLTARPLLSSRRPVDFLVEPLHGSLNDQTS
jgi:5-amino-6-(5-phosphoribosylamino)uracil reductase